MSDSTVLKVCLFTDLVGSTQLKQQFGDTAIVEIMTAHNDVFRQSLKAANGREEEFTGDGFFATFDRPSDAIKSALSFQQGLAKLNSPHRLASRVGVHMGEISVVPGSTPGSKKLLGLAVDTAARVMHLATAGQILLTRHAFDSVRQQVQSAPNGAPIEWFAHGSYMLKGVEHPLEIFEVGVRGIAPLSPPPGTESSRRMVAPGQEETLGWRPAIGLAVPGREHWILERELGKGGFGEVWLARHDATRDHRTFKFCFEADRLRTLKRELTLFRLMKEALGQREDIAKLYEVRLDEPPFFLEMEYAAGGSLNDWATARGGIATVPLETRLQLVAQVADALAAAHSVGVIHKDIKPPNVLVHENRDGSLQARLTDFGIGQLVTTEYLKRAGVTATGFDGNTAQMSDLGSKTGTQLYMAPEVTAGRTPTIHSDIYGLGVMLYQVAAGDLNAPLAHGWERNIKDDLIRDDIAACVAGLPEERLPSADVLARRLRSLPQRRAKRAAERQSSARDARRRSLLRASAVTAAILAVVAVVAGMGYRNASKARDLADANAELANANADEARLQAARAEALASFLQDMLTPSDPTLLSGDTTVRQILDRTANNLDHGAFADHPEILAAARSTIGNAYRALKSFPEAEKQIRAVLDLRKKTTGDRSVDVAVSLNDYAALLRDSGKLEEAENSHREALAIATDKLGDSHIVIAAINHDLAIVLIARGKYAEAEPFAGRAVQLRKTLPCVEDRLIADSLNLLGLIAQHLSRPTDAEKALTEAVERRRRGLGEAHPAVAADMKKLIALYDAWPKPDRASRWRKMLDDWKATTQPAASR